MNNLTSFLFSSFQSEFSTRFSKRFTEWIVDRECCQLSPPPSVLSRVCRRYLPDRQWVGIDQRTIWIRRVLRDVDTNVNHDFAKSSSPLHSCAWRHRTTCIKISCLSAVSAPLLIHSVDFQVSEVVRNEIRSMDHTCNFVTKELVGTKIYLVYPTERRVQIGWFKFR